MFNRLTGKPDTKPQELHQEPAQEAQERPTEGAQAEDNGKGEGSQKKGPLRLPFVFSLAYPYKIGDRTVREIRCDHRPTMRTMKRLAAAGENDGEILEIIFEDLFDLVPAEADRLDAEDGFNALEAVKSLFPQLGAGS